MKIEKFKTIRTDFFITERSLMELDHTSDTGKYSIFDFILTSFLKYINFTFYLKLKVFI